MCLRMYTVRFTQEFQDWLDALTDLRTQMRIVARLRRAEAGNLGDWKPVGERVSEMRVDVGPGYRLYFTRVGQVVIVMLVGATRRLNSGTSSARNASRASCRTNYKDDKGEE